MNVIEIRNLQKTYKNFSLTIDKLDIPEGYITGFIGPNGSGKTTTIKSLLGMTKLDSGEIKILNSDINKDTKTKEYIAYVGDESGFLEESKISSLHKIISKFYSNWDEDLYKKYINTGVKRIPEEISKMENLPEGFIELYKKLIESENIEEMKKGAKQFIGTHDFAAFKTQGSSVKGTVRTIFDVKVEKEEKVIKISVSGDGFLYNMVRIIVGTLINVGRGKTDAVSISDIINQKDRTLAGDCVPPHGLFLKEVYY